MKKYLIIFVLGLALVGFVAYGTTKAYAENESGSYPPIIQKLVERFGLNEEEVKVVFDETREKRRVEMQTRLENRLNEAIEGGDLTEAQKEAILAKKAEMQTNCGEFKDLSPEERQKKMQAHKEEMQTWAEANGVDLSQMHPLLGGGRQGGFGGPMFNK
ncbi:hypothetical protein KKD62_01900 [Patescibacteria group bacterium]|nr:hypothetical protein [Patescibacteria group bacterium]